MRLFYRPKHCKSKTTPYIDITIKVIKFIYEETTWYIKWWFNFIKKIFQRMYSLGAWLRQKGIWFIDKYDEALDQYGVMR